MVSNIFQQTKGKLITSLWTILYCRKNVTFWKDCIFTITSSVKEVKVIFK